MLARLTPSIVQTTVEWSRQQALRHILFRRPMEAIVKEKACTQKLHVFGKLLEKTYTDTIHYTSV
jgi:hypothetical protein